VKKGKTHYQVAHNYIRIITNLDNPESKRKRRQRRRQIRNIQRRGEVVIEKHVDKKRRTSLSIHAEEAVMRHLPKTILRRATMIVIRIGNDGQLCISKPCPSCQARIQKVGICLVKHS